MKAAKSKPAELPSRWLRSRTGRSYAYIIVTNQRDAGRRLYRMRYLAYDVKSPRLWTLDDIVESGARFLKHKPPRRAIEATR